VSDRDAVRLNWLCLVSNSAQTQRGYRITFPSASFSRKPTTRQLEDCRLQQLLSQKGLPMFSAEQYRAQAGEYAKLVGIANGPNEMQEFQRLERSLTELADNAQWVTENSDITVHATEHAALLLTPGALGQGNSQQ
jgi:hypothetical protein